MTNSNLRIHLSGIAACLLFLPIGDRLRAQSFDALGERIRAALVDEQVPSLAVAVARKGEILFLIWMM